MKKACIAPVICLIALFVFGAQGEEQPLLSARDGWSYVGYLYGGVTFAVPADFVSFDLTPYEEASGIVLVGGNYDFTLQLRVFAPEAMTYDVFKQAILSEKTAETATRMYGETEILSYRNTRPSAYSELFGIVLTGLDGKMYKISIFTGDNERFGPDEPVWEIARTVEATTRLQDFSEWGIEPEPSAA